MFDTTSLLYDQYCIIRMATARSVKHEKLHYSYQQIHMPAQLRRVQHTTNSNSTYFIKMGPERMCNIVDTAEVALLSKLPSWK